MYVYDRKGRRESITAHQKDADTAAEESNYVGRTFSLCLSVSVLFVTYCLVTAGFDEAALGCGKICVLFCFGAGLNIFLVKSREL